MQDNRRKISNFLINPRYQARYILWIVGTCFILTAVNCWILYTYIRENYAVLVQLLPITDAVRNQLYRELHHVILMLSLVSVFFLVIVSLIGLVLSHRTAGVMYHMKRVFNEIARGKRETRVHLRPEDDFQDVARAFNSMMDSLGGPHSHNS